MTDRVGLLGAGRHAIEVAGYCAELGLIVAFYFEEAPPAYAHATAQFGAPIFTTESDLSEVNDVAVVGAVGDGALRRRLIKRWPGVRYQAIVATRSWVSPDAIIAEGATIAPLAAVNRFVEVGPHVIVNTGAIVSHDVVVGEYTTIGPGVRIGGGATIGPGALLGIGSTVRDHVTVGANAVVGAGAVVVDDVAAGTTVTGVPARQVTR